MSIPTYAITNDLPAPVTSGSNIQSFVDVTGDVWVAKNGVYSGAWRRARDVLHGVIYRTAAYTPKVSPGEIMPYDTREFDNYNLYTGSPNYGFNIPVTGWYKVAATVNGISSAVNSYIQGWIQQNTPPTPTITLWSSDNMITPQASGGIPWRSDVTLYALAGDYVNTKVYMSGTLTAIYTMALVTRMELSFMGPG